MIYVLDSVVIDLCGIDCKRVDGEARVHWVAGADDLEVRERFTFLDSAYVK